MPLNPAAFFGAVDTSNPQGTDSRTIADEQFRELFISLKAQFPNLFKSVASTADDLELLTGLAGSGAKIMTGAPVSTIGWWYMATAPLNWTYFALDGNVRNLTVGNLGGVGQYGSDDPTTIPINTTVTVNLPAATSPHTLTEQQIPSHVHGIAYRASSGGTADALGSSGSGGVQTFTSNPTGGGQGHSHNIGGTATGTGTGTTLNPRYAQGIFAYLNA